MEEGGVSTAVKHRQEEEQTPNEIQGQWQALSLNCVHPVSQTIGCLTKLRPIFILSRYV